MLSLLVAQLSLWPEFLDLLLGSGGCGGFCTTWDTMLLVFSLRYQLSAKMLA
jgi:hypothetical protein